MYLYTDGFSCIDIANTLYISKSSVVRIIKIYEKWACVTYPFKGIPDRRKLFNRGDMYILQSLIRDKVNWYLDELICEMENLTGKKAVYYLYTTLYHLANHIYICDYQILKLQANFG